MSYEILDVSMDYEDKILLVIALHAPNTDHQCFFQFEKPLASLSHGEMDQHHVSALQVRKAKTSNIFDIVLPENYWPTLCLSFKRETKSAFLFCQC